MWNYISFIINLDIIIMRFRLLCDVVCLSVFAKFVKPFPGSSVIGYVSKTYSMIDYVGSEAGNLIVVGRLRESVPTIIQCAVKPALQGVEDVKVSYPVLNKTQIKTG